MVSESTGDGKPNSPEGKQPGFSERPQVEFSGQDDERDFGSGREHAAKPTNDGFDGFVPSIPATATFTAEEAQSREGNYVLSLGLGGSGKSTFHSFLLRFIEQSGKLNYEMRIPRLKSGEEDGQTRNLLNQWRSSWSRGEFVLPTAATENAIREIKYKVVPNRGMKIPLEFGLIEVSGELLRQVQGGRTGRQTLPEAVHHLIANPRVKLTVLMMVHPDTPSNDILLANFIDYISQKFPGRLRQISLGVVIANPDRALAQLIATTGGESKSPFAHYQRLEDDAIIDYMKTMSPGIWSQWQSWPEKNRMITPLRLGDIQLDTSADGAPVPRLVSPDFTHIEKIFLWLFEKFTGRRPGPTLWDRLKGS